MTKRFYITTPIYYVNSVPHIGHALTMFVCDFTRRYWRYRGRDVLFATGTDENATKVFEAAQKAGKDPHAFVDEVSQAFRDCWAGLDLEYDDFIRTTEPRHVRAVQRFFNLLRERGYVYLDKYEGWYDVSAETFVKESDVVDGKSPDGNEVRWVSEENWFFRLSAFGDRLLEHIEREPCFLLPETRKNEVASFIRQGLRDMCITRTNPGWGIPVPGDDGKVVYVWFDALINYLAVTGWPEGDWQSTWPADVHWMAKEIFTRFHATLWPAMLLAADLPLPKTVIAHGWFTFGEDKMSKSKGNVIAPMELVDEIVSVSGCAREQAIDTVRYCLAALLPYEGDTNFTREEVFNRYNADLANDLGNALNRSLAMTQKFAEGRVPDAPPETEAIDAIRAARTAFERHVDAFRLDEAVDAAWSLIRFLNKYIDTRAPWQLAKTSDPALGGVIRSMLLCLRAIEGLVRPLVPATADAIADQLGLPPLPTWSDIGEPASMPAAIALGQARPLFPRIDLKAMQQIPEPKPVAAPAPGESHIGIDDFMKVRLQVGRVLEADEVPNSEKLLRLVVKLDGETRQIIAGIKKSYAPLDLVGRQVVVVTNLKPAKLAGLESQGMVLAADGPDGEAILLTLDREAPLGSGVH